MPHPLHQLADVSTHTQSFYGSFSGTIQVNWCQKKSSGLLWWKRR